MAMGKVCRKAGISEQTSYSCRKQYAGLMPSEMKRLRQLEEENGKLKKLVVDFSLDRAMLQEMMSKKLHELRGNAPLSIKSVRAGRCQSFGPAGCCERTRRRITTRANAPRRSV